jgi:CBS domain-containing protein
MTSPVVSALLDTPVSHVAALLAEHRISAVPVLDIEGAILGVITEYDLLAKKGSTAAEVMTPGVISVTEDTDVDDVRALLIDRRMHRIPVMSGRELVGIVSRSDLVALLLTEWSCGVCGEAVRGEAAPEKCPRCAAPASRFAEQEQLPGD